MRIVHEWLSELAAIPDDVDEVAREISLRGFEVASVDKGVIDFDITANRPDCLSHLGIAREATVIWKQPPLEPSRATLTGQVVQVRADYPAISLEARDLCPRYAAQLFEVKVGPSPDWLVRRLDAAGVRSINNVVDVTNYVMLEIGQPMHAFDLQRLHGERLVVRRARSGESLRTLDEIERALDPEMVVIADAERAVAIGGVMGGADTEINGATTRMVLESAYFDPGSIRRTSKRLGLRTEASTRFERGADIEAPRFGLSRAEFLLTQIGAAAPGPADDLYPERREPLHIELRASRIAQVLGVAVPPDDVARILHPLGFLVEVLERGRWRVTVPSFRVDVTREVDLIEEVGRHYGFDRIPVTFPGLDAAQSAPDVRIERDATIRRIMTAAGFSESMTFAFIEHAAALPFCAPGMEPAAIANPLSEKFAVLRPSLLPGLVDSCSHNRRRGRKNVRLFETGSRFTQGGERRAIAFAWAGERTLPHWSSEALATDFFDVKGVAERLCQALGIGQVDFAVSAAPFLVRGRSADIQSGERLLGTIGLLDPVIAAAHDFPAGEEIYVAEIDLDAVAEAAPRDDLRSEPLPKFPAIIRDLSILVAEALPAAAVRGTIRSAAPKTLESLVEFDRYQGKGVPEGRISLSLRLTFRSPERTLTDDEVEAAMGTIVEALKAAHGAERR